MSKNAWPQENYIATCVTMPYSTLMAARNVSASQGLSVSAWFRSMVHREVAKMEMQKVVPNKSDELPSLDRQVFTQPIRMEMQDKPPQHFQPKPSQMSQTFDHPTQQPLQQQQPQQQHQAPESRCWQDLPINEVQQPPQQQPPQPQEVRTQWLPQKRHRSQLR